MRRIILEVQVSIDGYIAESNGNTDWMIWNWGPDWKWDEELQEYHNDLTKSADCILISRQMAEEGFIAHWAKVAENFNDPQYSFSKHITDTPKVVISTTLDKSISIPGGWSNTNIIRGDLVTEINLLKKTKGRNILVYGGATLVSSLIKAQLIDEFHLLINPVILGKGLSIFSKVDDRQNVKLIKSKSFDCGIGLLHFELKGNWE
jgi:dihydrofolate reductase